MYYASLCTIAKDEDEDYLEWVLYHLAVGFEHIIIYDNNSKNPIKKILSEFIDKGLVTVYDLNLEKVQQLSAYFHCLNTWRANTYWLAFIDIDEFIVPVSTNDIKDLLDNYKDYGGLAVNWKIFSSSGHISRPKGTIIENYCELFEVNNHIKSIVRPELTVRPLSPHHFFYKDGYYCVNSDYIPVNDFYSYPLIDKVCINHYFYKSQQDFEKKINRGRATQSKTDRQLSLDLFYSHLKRKTVEDKEIFKFLSVVDLYAKLPAKKLCDTIKKEVDANSNLSIDQIINFIDAGNISAAKRLYTRIMRYKDCFDLRIIGISLALLSKGREEARKLLQSEMARPGITDEEQAVCYQKLAVYYNRCNKPMIADSILKML